MFEAQTQHIKVPKYLTLHFAEIISVCVYVRTVKIERRTRLNLLIFMLTSANMKIKLKLTPILFRSGMGRVVIAKVTYCQT